MVQRRMGSACIAASGRPTWGSRKPASQPTPAGGSRPRRRQRSPAGDAAVSTTSWVRRRKGPRRLDHSSKFVPGNRAAQLVRALFERYQVRGAAMPFLRQLSIGTGKTTTLCLRIGWYGVRAGLSLPASGNYQARRLGEISRLHEEAAGMAVLSRLAASDLTRYRARASAQEGVESAVLDEALDAVEQTRAIGATAAPADGGARSVAFPIEAPDAAPGAITVEGLPAMDAAGLRDFIARWRFVLADLSAILAEHPERYTDPFGHIDPDEISLAMMSC